MKRMVWAVLLGLGLMGLISQRDALAKVPVFLSNEPEPGEAKAMPDIAEVLPEDTKVMPEAVTKNRVGSVEGMQIFLRELCELRKLPEVGIQNSMRSVKLELRERLFAVLGEVLSGEPKPLQMLHRRPLEPDCNHPSLEHLLTGQRRTTPLMLVDMPSGMGGGPELDFMELHMLELQGIADLFVVGETGYTFRGDKKPRLYQMNRARFQPFEKATVYLDIDQCLQYQEAIKETRAFATASSPWTP